MNLKKIWKQPETKCAIVIIITVVGVGIRNWICGCCWECMPHFGW